tara:strand:+ start:1363 stop:3387 length:2025 start_codon:yes stop_codon:yes gene_type:complete
MAGEKNFNVKNGLSVGGVEVINSSGDLVAGGVGTAVNEAIADKIGGIISATGGATATYNDGADTIVIDVPITDEDNMASNSATALASQQSIKAYVDSQILTKDNTDEITEGSTNLYFTNARADARITNALKDEDNMASDSATHVPSQQSVKAYVDAVTTSLNAQDLDATTDSGSIDIDLDTETLSIVGGEGINTSATGTTITVAGEEATDSNKGVAAFNAVDFTVSSGTVTVNAERIQDIAGAMMTGNTESGITVAYEDGDGTIDFTVGTLNQNTTGSAATLTTPRTIHGVSFDGSANIDLTEVVQDTVGAMVGSNTETGITVSYEDGDGTLDFVVGTLNQDTTGNAATATALETARTIHGVSFDGTGNIDLTEVVQDTVGAMFSSNTETGITVGYEDGDGTIDLAVGTLNQNTTGSAATLTTARTIALSGDVAGSVSFDGSANATISTTVQANSVALGTDTTGNYMTEIAGGTGVSVSHTAGEGSTATLSIGQAVSTSSDVTFADIAATDLTLSGNLTVNGTTTTASSTNTVIADTLIELGNGTSGTPANDSGFVIERGSADNAFIGFDESADKFTVGTGSFTGASTGNLTISTGTLVANIEGNLTGNVTGNTSGTAGGLSGTPNISVGTIASGAITITNATNAGGTARNVYQSTSAPGGSDGAVGDLWVLYS